MKWMALLPLLVAGGLGIVFVISLSESGDDTLPSVLVGQSAPPFDLAALPGREKGIQGLATTELADGQIKLVNFWASWCAPCRTEHPTLMTLAEKDGIAIHGVNYKDRPEAALRFLEGLGDPFTKVGRDETGRAAIDWGVYGVPETFVVDGQGRILARHAGPVTPEIWETVLAPHFDGAG